jgi:hypothetical protein
MTIWEFLRLAETAKVHFRDRATQGRFLAENHRVSLGTGPKN